MLKMLVIQLKRNTRVFNISITILDKNVINYLYMTCNLELINIIMFYIKLSVCAGRAFGQF